MRSRILGCLHRSLTDEPVMRDFQIENFMRTGHFQRRHPTRRGPGRAGLVADGHRCRTSGLGLERAARRVSWRRPAAPGGSRGPSPGRRTRAGQDVARSTDIESSVLWFAGRRRQCHRLGRNAGGGTGRRRKATRHFRATD